MSSALAEQAPVRPDEEVDGFVPLDALPRPAGRLAKEDLAPLVRLAQTGDPHAVHELLKFVKPVVVRYCRSRMGGRDLSYLSADDVAQEVCVAVLKVLPSYQERGGSFLYLVRAIAANKVADAYRTVSRDRSDPVAELPDTGLVRNEPETFALQHDLGERLGRLLAALPRSQQEILTLRIVVGLSSGETAEALGMSAGNVRITQYRALERLRCLIHFEEF